MASVRIVVPGPPRGKGAVTTTRFGGFLPKRTTAEMEAVSQIAMAAMGGRPPFEGPLEVKLCAYVPVTDSWPKAKKAAALAGTLYPTSKPDIDNICKLTLDGMNKIVRGKGKNRVVRLIAFRDDSQIVKLTAWKIFSADPRVVVEIRKIET